MALRGETIGRAYIKILADGTGFRDSARDELRGADQDFEDAGEEHSKAYQRGFAQEQQRNKTFEESFRGKLDKVFGQVQARSEFVGRDMEDRLAEHLNQALARGLDPDVASKAAQRSARAIFDEFERGGNLDISFGNVTRQWDRALSDMRKSEDDFLRNHRSVMDEAERVSQQAFRAQQEAASGFQRGLDGLRATVLRYAESTARATKTHGAMASSLRTVEKEGHSWFLTLDRISDGVGKAFGKGARNNFFNLVGTVIGGLTAMGFALIKGVAQLADWARGLGDASQAMAKFGEEQAVTAAAVEQTAAEVAATGPPGFIALAIAIGAIVAIAPIAVSALSALAAAVVAVASSMAFAVAGGLGVFAGLMLPLAGAIGTVVLGWKEMKKELKDTDFGPLKRDFQALREDAGEGLADGVRKALPALENGLGRIRPIIVGVSAALGDVIARFAAIADSRAFAFFTRVMTEFLPSAIRGLGAATANFAQGMLNIFGVLGEPGGPVDQFITWLGDITREFRNWSSEKGGRADIRQFFDRAAESGREWWGLLKSIGGTLERVFFNVGGKRAGDSIVAGIADAFDRLNSFLDRNPGAIARWFGNGRQIAAQVGHAIEGIVKVFDTLDTPENRRAATFVIRLIVINLKILDGALRIAGAAFHGFNRVVKAVLLAVAATFLSWARDFIRVADFAFGWIGPIGRKLDAAAAHIDAWTDRVNASLHGVENRVEIKITVDARQAMADTAQLNAMLNGIPASVSTTLYVKYTKLLGSAEGGLFVGPQMRLIGEAGPEAVVPLNRPLSQVDPAVRALSAVAQGKATVATTVNGTGQTNNIGPITVITPTKDPVAVARETVNRMVAASYLA